MTDLPAQDLDLAFLYEIADGSDDFIVDSIGMFLDQTPQLLSAIEGAINSQDWQTAAQSAHKLKPNLGFFGMPWSQETIQQVEIACKMGAENPAEITEKFNAVKTMVNNNLVELEKIKKEKEANL
ncbi:Hpt domain-containing protein [Mucilaginibacter terrenus]|uniref:Hpt domain-containing protein n=1 Tax=Mucilaginibacter terrenus TaxID=2482727 RepID=A0A3E2NWY7_9SPHI|nr:Hpt domain-containing protein [Mucilaginibacter terrenus]RFZ85536.1 Hpt domain-containing protein [Mucilaginibacter terrenus]